jgi:Uncharacterised protein family UPF0547
MEPTPAQERSEIERRARELENLRRAAEQEARQQARADAAAGRNAGAEPQDFAPAPEGYEPPRYGATSQTDREPEFKVCPQCAEEVKAAARICRFCRFEFGLLPEPAPSATSVPQSMQPAATSSETPDGSVPPSRADLAVDLERTTQHWTVPQVLGTFDASPAGLAESAGATAVMHEHGYEPGSSGTDAQGRTTVMYTRRQGPPVSASKPVPTPKPAKGPTPEAGAGDGTKQGIIGLVLLGGLALGVAGLIQTPGINWAMVVGGVVIFVFGVILMMAAFPNGMPDTSQERSELKRVTGNWTVPFVVRSYKNDDNGRALASKEAAYLTQYGYAMAGQSGTGSHVNVGRTASRVVLTGGLGLIFGASRSKATIEITFVRQ